MHIKSIISVAAALVLIGGGSSAQAYVPAATPLQKVSAATQPGIVYLTTKFQATVYDPQAQAAIGDGKVFTVAYDCSGFFVDPDGDIASAGHCVDYDGEVKADILTEAAKWSFEHERWQPGSTLQGAIDTAVDQWKVRSPDYVGGSRPARDVTAAYGVQAGGLPTGKALPARVLGFKRFDDGDVSLLKIDAHGDVPALALAPDDSVDIGTAVVSIGYPASVDLVTDQTFDPSFKDGSISSKKTVGSGRRDVLEMSAAISPGMSGGPTVDMQGRVVGINSFKPSEESGAFNFVSPTKELRELMRDKGVTPARSESDKMYTQGLAAFFAGNREQAVKSFDAVLQRDPGHQLAQTYRARALKLPATHEKAGGAGTLLVALVLAMLAAIGGTIAALRRRSNAHADAPVKLTQDAPSAPQGAAADAAPLDSRTDATVINEVPTEMASFGLQMNSGPRAGERFDLSSETVIGRTADADLQLDEAEVSRRHAILRVTVSGTELTDLGSSNGTRVNGKRVDRSLRLHAGDVIRIGTSELEMTRVATVERDAATRLNPIPA